MLGALDNPVELWNTFKREILEAARGCVRERSRSRGGFVSVETLDSIAKSYAARLAGNQNQYRALSRRIRTLLRRDEKRYVRSLAEDVEDHLNANVYISDECYPNRRRLPCIRSGWADGSLG